MNSEIRSQYPILKSKTYLASHSLGAVPSKTSESLQEYYRIWAEQGIGAWDGPWSDSIAEFSNSVAGILGAAQDSIVPMENVTRGFAAVASCLDFTGQRNRVVMTDLEFLTSYPFWQGLRALGAEIVLVKSEDGGITVPTEKLIAAIDERTLIVPTSHVYFRSGAVQDLRAVTQAAHAKGAYVLGDGYQAAGVVPMNLAEMQIDFYVGGSHKWLCGGPGAGFLYVRPDLVSKLTPRLTGWFGIDEPFEYEATTEFKPHAGVRRFLAGTPSVPALYAAREGIRTVAQVGMKAIRAHSEVLTEQIIARADERGFEVRTPRDVSQRSGMVCLQFDRSKEVAEVLNREGVIVDWRPNCGIRVSPHFYSLDTEIERFFEVADRAIL
jgi:kynureninase